LPDFTDQPGNIENLLDTTPALVIPLQISCFISADAIGCAKNVINGVQNAQRTLDPINPLTTA
jgi:hypothetical protein